MESALENIFTELSRYELLELFYTISGNVTNNITVLITALSAYLALAYIAGKDLSKFQVYSISVIYSAFVLFMIGGISRDSQTLSYITTVLFDINASADSIILTIVLLMGWLLSIVFMVQTRKEKGKNNQ